MLYRPLISTCFIIFAINLVISPKLFSIFSQQSYFFIKCFMLYLLIDLLINIKTKKRIEINVHHITGLFTLSIHLYNNICPPFWSLGLGLLEIITASRILLYFKTNRSFIKVRKKLTYFVRLPTIFVGLFYMKYYYYLVPLSSFIVQLIALFFLLSFDFYHLRLYNKILNI